MPRINYLIAAAAHRTDKDDGSGIFGNDTLRWHFKMLSKTNTQDLSQITLIRALPLQRAIPLGLGDNKDYWDIEDEKKGIKCPIEILDVPDSWFSYSSWIHACQKYQDTFDYCILIEDDFYPACKNFAKVLVQLHQEKLPYGGYLNGYTSDHAALSNGIVDSTSFLRGISKYPDPIAAIAGAAQVNFSIKIFDNLADFTDKYRSMKFFSPLEPAISLIHDQCQSCSKDIFLPVQYAKVKQREIVYRLNLSSSRTKKV